MYPKSSWDHVHARQINKLRLNKYNADAEDSDLDISSILLDIMSMKKDI